MPHDKKSKRKLSETDKLDSNQLDQDESMDENQLKPVKKHKCPFCDKRFTQPNSVSRHVSGVHEGEKPFVCEICGASFSQNKNLAVHIAAKHEGKRPFQCDLCGVRYREKRCLQRHKRRMHFDKNTLDECLINKIPSIPVTRTDLNDQKKCKQKVKHVNNPSMHREHKRLTRSETEKNKQYVEVRTKLNVQMERNEFLDVWVKKERNDLNKKVSNADNTNQALEKNLKEISQALTYAKISAKSEIGKLKQEKSELQTLNKTMFVEMKMKVKILLKKFKKLQALEKERDNLNKKEQSNADNTNQALEKNLKEISQDLTDAKIEIGKLKQEKSELQVEANINKTMFVEMKESNSKANAKVKILLKKFKKLQLLEKERDNLNKQEQVALKSNMAKVLINSDAKLKSAKFSLKTELASTQKALEETKVECVEKRSEIQALEMEKIKLETLVTSAQKALEESKAESKEELENQLKIEAASKKSL